VGQLPPDQAAALRAIGFRVKAARKAKGLTQEKLGHAVDLHRTFVGRVERAETNATAWTLIRMAAGLDIDPGTLLTGLRPGMD
jgi:transcriptional regulator with XRE-family HTH domain